MNWMASGRNPANVTGTAPAIRPSVEVEDAMVLTIQPGVTLDLGAVGQREGM